MNRSYIVIVKNGTHLEAWQSELEPCNHIVALDPARQDVSDLVAEGAPNLVIVAVDAPPEVELSICRQLHAKISCPLLLLTSCENEAHWLTAYQQGVDECILRAVSPSLFLAKVTSWLRWSPTPEETLPALT
jgi:DNA-binding response OmpR family regulator